MISWSATGCCSGWWRTMGFSSVSSTRSAPSLRHTVGSSATGQAPTRATCATGSRGWCSSSRGVVDRPQRCPGLAAPGARLPGRARRLRLQGRPARWGGGARRHGDRRLACLTRHPVPRGAPCQLPRRGDVTMEDLGIERVRIGVSRVKNLGHFRARIGVIRDAPGSG